MILLKKRTTNVLMRLRGCAGWSGPYCYKSLDWFSHSQSNCYMCHLTMAHIRKQDAKFDYRAILEFRLNCNLCSLFKPFSVNI